jgi:two-component system, chemotaxis family, sensor kinase CheA
MSLDLTQFHESFFEESFEALGSMEAALLELNAGEADADRINAIFRVAHSIKGGSATFGFGEVAHFTHALETLLDQLRSGRRQVQPDIVEVLLRSVDVLREMLTATRHKQPINAEVAAGLHAQLQTIIQSAASAGAAAAPTHATPGPAQAAVGRPAMPGWRIRLVPGPQMLRHGSDPLRMLRELSQLGALQVRVDAGKLPSLAELEPEHCLLSWNIELRGPAERAAIEQIFDWAEGECELDIQPLSPAPVVATGEPAATAPTACAPRGATAPAVAADGGSIRVSLEKIDELLNSVGELVITQSVLSQLAAAFEGRKAEELRNALFQLERHMRSLQGSVMRVRMLPISSVFNRVPRMIRDLGQRLGKKVELRMYGEHTELDKTVLEKIGDPLVHLVRNAVDHGIEMPDRRRAAGKAEHGTIELNAYHKGGHVIVEVSDDGGGLDRERILAKARERGLVAADEEPSEEQLMNLIFAPGFSTAEKLSEVSGRGVGMDVVRRNIKEIGGHVHIQSNAGHGSTVRIRLPLTLAILDGQLVRVGGEIYIVPIVSIVETIQIKREQLGTVAQQVELCRLRDEYVPIIRLHELFDVQVQQVELLDGLLMIVEADGKRVGLFVDELLAQQQVVIKSLETNFRAVMALAGATMLGDGRVALILDIPGIILRFKECAGRRITSQEAA